MAFCNSCGATLDGGAKFCTKCGATQPAGSGVIGHPLFARLRRNCHDCSSTEQQCPQESF